jgi:hypothetical protein
MEKYIEESDGFSEPSEGQLKIIPRDFTKVILKEFNLKNKNSFFEINEIVLTPKFTWSKPDEWSKVLLNQNLNLNITCVKNTGEKVFKPYYINSFNDPSYFNPTFKLKKPIHIPVSILEEEIEEFEYPIKVIIELTTSRPFFEFDVNLVSNQSF